MKCHYEKSHVTACVGPVTITFHDARGCVDVCFGHAQWRLTTSMAFGHSGSCHSAGCHRLKEKQNR
jgi:hypothetical protein